VSSFETAARHRTVEEGVGGSSGRTGKKDQLMANAQKDLFDSLRARGVRKKWAKPIAKLDGNSQRAGAKGEKLARKAVDELTAAADDIEKRVLRTNKKRSEAARKGAQTRKRNASKRKSTARKGAQTRKRVARARSRKR
jgi:hypothetical protein